ncbi:MAG: restriction endonuclease subunit S [Ruminococcaceae bacterium]|nr:restriction endonuclease subunit S [Oscillospiraceae bacterium]
MKMVTVGDLGKIITGKTPPTKDKDNYGGDIPFITPVDMVGNRNIFNTERYISKKGLNTVKNCFLPEHSVCVSCIGSDMGKSVITVKPSVTNQQINSIIVDENSYDYLYVYYLMRTLEEKIKSLGKNATAVPILNKTKFSNIEVSIFDDLERQKAISSILSAYDNLIENNQKQIKLLEEAAQRLYKEWFVDLRFPGYETTPIVDGLPEGWRKDTIGGICSLKKDVVTTEQIPKGTPYIGLEHIPRVDFCLSSWGNAEDVTSNKYKYDEDDIIFGKIRPYFHKVGFAINNGVVSTDSFVMRAKNGLWGILLMTVFDKAFVDYTYQTCKEGAKMPRADWRQMEKFEVLIPDDAVRQAFEDYIWSITRRIKTLAFQNRGLSEARDRLLPKLMSGEIEV